MLRYLLLIRYGVILERWHLSEVIILWLWPFLSFRYCLLFFYILVALLDWCFHEIVEFDINFLAHLWTNNYLVITLILRYISSFISWIFRFYVGSLFLAYKWATVLHCLFIAAVGLSIHHSCDCGRRRRCLSSLNSVLFILLILYCFW